MEVRQTLGGRYKLLDELGSGGMAVVWRARDEVLGRTVAVKLLAGRFAGDPQSRARIRDEARAAATLSHPNIAQVYDYGEAIENGVPIPYVVMELVNGPTLQQRVTAGPLPPRTIFRICGEVAAALAAAHLDGLVHRDIKMANIMVTTSGAKVVDFGIAAAAGPAAPDEMLVGTPAYLAPERLTGDAIVPASDVYALGVLLYRLLTSESPWSVESTTQMLRAHIYVDPEPLPPLAGVPPAVADLIARCLRKDPASRPSANEVSAALGDAAEASDAVRGEAVPKLLGVPGPADGRADDLDAHTSEWSPPPNEALGSGRRRRRRAESPDEAAAAAAAGGVLGAAAAHGPANTAAAAGSGAASAGGEPPARLGPGGGNSALGGRGDVDPAHDGPGGVDPARGGSGSEMSARGGPGGGNPALGGSGGGYPALGGAGGAAAESAAAAGGLGADGPAGAEGVAGGMALAGRGGEERPAGGKRSADGKRSAGRRRSASGDPPEAPGGSSPAGRAGHGDDPGGDRAGESRRGANAGPGGEPERGPERNAGPGHVPGRRAARLGINRRESGVAETLPGMLLETPPRHERAQSGGDAALRVRKNERADRPPQRPGAAPPRGGRRYRGDLRRKAALVGAAVAVIVAALAGWFLAGSAEKAPPDGGAEGITSVQPAPGALPQTPVATGPAGQSLPAPTDMPGRPPIAGGGPGVSSVSPGGSAQASPSVGEGTPGSSGSPAASAAPRGTRLTSKGGVVYATCGGGKATLTSWQPAQGYSVEKVNQGPGLAAVIVFKGPSDKYRMTVTCVAGTPTPVVLPL